MTGVGSILRFTFWFWFSGMLSICIVEAGTMYGGFCFPMNSFSSFTSTGWLLTTYAAMNFPPVGLSKACTVASLMPGNWRMTASTSFSSMRKPRIFTCPSLRPTNCILPSGR